MTPRLTGCALAPSETLGFIELRRNDHGKNDREPVGREERQRSSVYATVESVLEAFSDPSVLASAAAGGEICPEALLDGGANTVYLCAPAHEQERLQPVFVAVVRQLLEAALERALRLPPTETDSPPLGQPDEGDRRAARAVPSTRVLPA